MSTQMGWSWRILGGAAAAMVLIGSGMGVGVALTGGAAAATGAAAAHPAGNQACAKAVAKAKATGTAAAKRQALAHCQSRLVGLARQGVIHIQRTVKTKTGYSTIAFERGTIASVGGGTLTVKAPDGTTWTWHLLKGSMLREDGAKVAASKLATGDQVLVAGPVVSGANDVKLAQIRPASSPAPPGLTGANRGQNVVSGGQPLNPASG